MQCEFRRPNVWRRIKLLHHPAYAPVSSHAGVVRDIDVELRLDDLVGEAEIVPRTEAESATFDDEIAVQELVQTAKHLIFALASRSANDFDVERVADHGRDFSDPP